MCWRRQSTSYSPALKEHARTLAVPAAHWSALFDELFVAAPQVDDAAVLLWARGLLDND